MEKVIDCLFIGHNEVGLVEYEKCIRPMGINTGAYRDLNLNFISYDNRPYTVPEIFNLFNGGETDSAPPRKPLNPGDLFSAAIAYLGTYLDRRGFTFDYINSFQDEKKELKQKLESENILTIAVITTLYVSVFPILEIIGFIKKYNRSAKIIIGGPFVYTQFKTQESMSLEFMFESTIGADFYVISSQGEATLVQIIHALKNNFPPDGIHNIYYKTDSGYRLTPTLKEDNKLSENMVDWSLFSGKLKEVIYTRESISCPFSCSFCGFPERAGKYQTVPPNLVMEELNALEQIESVKTLSFLDDTFNVPVKRFKDILKGMIKRGSRLKWLSNFRCQFADREMVELMKKSGCEAVFLGIESANDQILKNMNKMVTVEKYREGMAMLKEFDIAVFCSFVIGFPGETRETVRDTVKFIEETEPDFFRAQLWYCESVTPIWKQRDKYGLKGESFEWSHATMDAKTASDLVEEIFLSVKNSVWVPQYHFDFSRIWSLIHRGMHMDQVKDFLKAFNRGIKEKLTDPSRKEISIETLMQIRESCRLTNGLEDIPGKKTTVVRGEDVKFNF